MKCDVVEGVIGTPVGPYEVGACPRGVHRLGLEDRVTNENFLSLGTKGITFFPSLYRVVTSRFNVSEVRLQKNLLAPCQLECLRPILDWLTVFFSSQGDKVFPDVEPCDDVVDARSPEFKHKVCAQPVTRRFLFNLQRNCLVLGADNIEK